MKRMPGKMAKSPSRRKEKEIKALTGRPGCATIRQKKRKENCFMGRMLGSKANQMCMILSSFLSFSIHPGF